MASSRRAWLEPGAVLWPDAAGFFIKSFRKTPPRRKSCAAQPAREQRAALFERVAARSNVRERRYFARKLSMNLSKSARAAATVFSGPVILKKVGCATWCAYK
jgi:hypothetical protein